MERNISGYSDAEIVEGIKNKDSWAFKSLYSIDRNGIINFVMNNNGDHNDGEDALQEGVIGVWKNILANKYKLSEGARLKTYLNKISRNWWYNQLRIRGITFQIADDFELEDIIVDVEDSDERIKKLSKYFSLLGEKCQSILKLRFWEKKKLEEIAIIRGNTLQVIRNGSSKCIRDLFEMYNNNKP